MKVEIFGILLTKNAPLENMPTVWAAPPLIWTKSKKKHFFLRRTFLRYVFFAKKTFNFYHPGLISHHCRLPV